MATKKKAAPRKKSTVRPAAKKKTAKKASPKKKVIAKKKATPAKKKAVTKKKAAPKKTAKSPSRVNKATVPAKRKRTAAKNDKAIKQKAMSQPSSVEADSQLPPVEEKSTAVNPQTAIPAPGMDRKSLQQAATRNYDNHHLRLSNKKGGIKPSGKKPLW